MTFTFGIETSSSRSLHTLKPQGLLMKYALQRTGEDVRPGQGFFKVVCYDLGPLT